MSWQGCKDKCRNAVDFVRGVKTLLFLALPLLLTGFFDITDRINLRDVLPERLGWAVVWIGVAAVVFRYFSSGPVLEAWRNLRKQETPDDGE